MYRFQEILGQDSIKQHLQNAVLRDHPSHAYILSGESGMGKKTMAKTFAMALQCEETTDEGEPCGQCRSCRQFLSDNHPDVIYVTHEKPGSVGVDDIRRLTDDVTIKPYRSPYKIYIVDDAEKMTPQAQNALLKTIEEPPEYAVFVLLADNPQRLLETVRSRCETVSLNPGKTELSEKAQAAAREVFAAFIAGDRMGLVRAVQPMEKLVKNELFDMMTALRRETLNRVGELSEAQAERLCDAADGGDKMIDANIKGGNVAGWLLSELLV